MSNSSPVRLGLIGYGVIGKWHASYLRSGQIARCTLAAVSDADASLLATCTDLPTFTGSRELIRSGLVDAVLIATPHYAHTTIGIDALEQGLHVLVEKPISVHKADCERLLAAHTDSRQVFAAMFQLRTMAMYRKLKQLIDSGELGDLLRVTWIATDWLRTNTYYASGGWRATWKGEGGGILMNQCPHQLDLLQWLFGMPSRLRAFCGFGKRHAIEVEDEVTTYMEFPNGATGVFIASTGEAPGTNRLEIAGERGKVIAEQGKLHFTRTEMRTDDFIRTASVPMGTPDLWEIELPLSADGNLHALITQNFVDAVLDGAPLIAPATEGIKSVELANAMVSSTLTADTVNLPLDSAVYAQQLDNLIASSTPAGVTG